jgi:hypothetical protein
VTAGGKYRFSRHGISCKQTEIGNTVTFFADCAGDLLHLLRPGRAAAVGQHHEPLDSRLGRR